MTPTEILIEEHKIILMMLDVAERESDNIESSGKVDSDTISKLVDFIRNFADGCHHAKEEKLLFVKLEEKGMAADSGPIGVMLSEHSLGRKFTKGIADNLKDASQGEATALEYLKYNLNGYINLLRTHINKENNILFRMAEQMLSQSEQEELLEQFEKVEKEERGEDIYKYYSELAVSLALKYSVR